MATAPVAPPPTAPPPPEWGDGQKPLPAEALGAPAGFWIRFVAYMIDAFILGFGFILLVGSLAALVAILGLSDGTDGQEVSPAIIVIVLLGLLIQLVISWLYEALMLSGSRGATFGKQAVGVRVVNDTGGTLSFGRATLRYFLKAVVTPMVPLLIGYLTAAFTKRKRAVHDFMADTYVVKSS